MKVEKSRVPFAPRMAGDPDDAGSSSVRLRAQRPDAPPPDDDAIDLELDLETRPPASIDDDELPATNLVPSLEDELDDGDRDAKSLSVIELRAVRRSIARAGISEAPPVRSSPSRWLARLLVSLVFVALVLVVLGVLYAYHPG
jgi:hypothetical protein